MPTGDPIAFAGLAGSVSVTGTMTLAMTVNGSGTLSGLTERPYMRVYDFTVHVPGTEAIATAEAAVAAVVAHGDGAWTICLQTSSGYKLVYSSLEDVRVKAGDHVVFGQAIGTLAPTSSDAGDFALHYQIEFWKDGFAPYYQ